LFKSFECVHKSFSQELISSFQCNRAALIVGYYPVIDLALHEILSLRINEQNPRVVNEMFTQLLCWLEELLSGLLESLTPQHRLVVNSDHGMQSIHTTCYLNQHFADLDWLKFDQQGNIEWDNTLVAYHPAENGTLVLNLESDEPPPSEQEVRTQIMAFFDALLLEGAKVKSLAFIPEHKAYQQCLFLFPPDGVRIKSVTSSVYSKRSNKAGDHCDFATHPWLKGTLLTENIDHPKDIKEMYEVIDVAIGNLDGY